MGTYLIRFSFLGPLGRARLAPWVIRLLRYTPVAVIPGLVAPMVIWPAATGGESDPARILAACAALAVGIRFRSVLPSLLSGAAVLYAVIWLTGGM